jgi:hypothetical protein
VCGHNSPMHSCTTEMYIVYDIDCSHASLIHRIVHSRSPRKVDNGHGFILCWAMDVPLLSTYFNFTHTWNFSTGVLRNNNS